MSYIRVKKRQSKQGFLKYAYLVKTRRMYKVKKVKQRNLKYLGRVFRLNNMGLDLISFLGKEAALFINETSKKEIVLKLIEFELLNHGFKRIKNNAYSLNSEITADLDKFKIRSNKNKSTVLEINEGFLCEYTINSLLNFKFPNLNEKECGKYLANALLSAGIKLDEQLFLNLFDKFFKDVLPSTN